MVNRGAQEAGNTLLLVPAAMLVMMLLISLVVDAAVTYLGQRRLADLAAAAARDAVQALDHDAYYERGVIEIDRQTATMRIGALRALHDGDRSLHDVVCDLETMPSRAVVTCYGWVRPIVSPVWGTGDTRFRITAVESARAAER